MFGAPELWWWGALANLLIWFDSLFALFDPVMLVQHIFSPRLFLPLTHVLLALLILWPFDLMLIGGRDIVMDYPCVKFGDCTFSLLVLSYIWTHTHREILLNALLTQLSSEWVIKRYIANVHNSQDYFRSILCITQSIQSKCSSNRW